MGTLFVHGLTNAAVASCLAIVALAASRLCRNPYVVRGLWLVVLLKFVMPPLITLPIPGISLLQSTAEGTIEAQATAIQVETHARHSQLSDALIEPPTLHRLPTVVDKSTDSPTVAQSSVATFKSYVLLRSAEFVWLCGTLVMASIVLFRIWQFSLLLQQTRHAPESLQQRVADLAECSELKRPPLLRLTDGHVPPLLWCVGNRATILLPRALMDRIGDAALTAVLAHELTHLRRRDGWMRWLELIVVTCFWWCPFAWFARRKLQEVEEQCCDADVLRFFPALRKTYGSAVLETLEFLSDARRLTLGGTGFGSHSSLKRRFEMIVGARLVTPPAPAMRRLLLAGAVTMVLIVPAARSSEPRANEPVADPCTITLADGTIFAGQFLQVGNERIVVLSDDPPAKSMPSASGLDESPAKVLWKLELGDCVRIALEHNDELEAKLSVTPDGILLVSPQSADEGDLLKCRQNVESLIRDVEDAYWVLYLNDRNLEARKAGGENSLEFWRVVKAKNRVDDKGHPTDEANCRSQYFLFRRQKEESLTDLYRSESRLRWLLGLSEADGRFIYASTIPSQSASEFDWSNVHKEALSNRPEVLRQKQQIVILEDEPERANSPRSKALIARREKAVLRDIELEIVHQLGDAVRTVNLAHDVMETNRNRLEAARDEAKAIESLFHAGRITVDLV